MPSTMPTNEEMKAAGRSDLANALQKHGGYLAVARRLNLTYSRLERITHRTASEVEKIARAIQPLAESNLLSGAQVMVILRRAGLLGFRNQRVTRLNAGLARGAHDEIESAIAQIANRSDKFPTETVSIETNEEDLTAIEVEALVSEDLLTGETVSLTGPLSASSAPDPQREQTVIRGLSALGELRLPLDEVLGLLTSKILWEAFYRRLYAWYGSLDTAQNVTVEDVEAAILSVYPEHRDNEFVAEASARFAIEVEEAVNFAASLLDYGWCGPRLRLHQADAARKMAEVLSDQADHPFLLNADDPGMGKSAAFLAAVCASGIRSVVLVAPKTVADDTWCATYGEIRRCLPHAHIVRGLDATLSNPHSSQLTFFVLHYEELLNDEAIAALADRPFECLCLDEIHFIKQRAGQESTRRRTALEVLRASVRTAIGLTGTPLINELAEPMSLLQILSQHASQFDHVHLSSRRMGDIADVFEALLPHLIRRRKREVLLHLPYTWAEFEQGIARLYREGQRQCVLVDVLQTTTVATLNDRTALHTLDERIWDLIEGKRELSDVAVDGKYDTTDAAAKVQRALRRWLKQAREIGVEPLAVERRALEPSVAQKWRSEIARLRALSAAQADKVFADPEYTSEFLEHLKTSTAAKLSHQWLRGKLALLLRSDLTVVDMGCGLNPFADLPCRVIGLDRHELPGQLRGKMENPPLPDKSADVLIYSLSLYGTASDLLAYFTHATRILRGGGHLFIVEPASAFTPEGLVRFLHGLRQFGLELVGSVKDLRSDDGTLLKGMHITLTGEMGKAEGATFERK
ncbi:MAG TPA: SNF2-related protein [Candidatus Binatia bacterium]|nr:SNF2-related protein [Candidatus Binatia bacterium]